MLRVARRLPFQTHTGTGERSRDQIRHLARRHLTRVACFVDERCIEALLRERRQTRWARQAWWGETPFSLKSMVTGKLELYHAVVISPGRARPACRVEPIPAGWWS